MSDNVEKPLSYQSTRKRARTLGLCERLVFICSKFINLFCFITELLQGARLFSSRER